MIHSDSHHSLLREKERRNSPRLAVERLVYVAVAPDNSGLLADLGEEGMCISIANPLALSTEIHFSFTLGERRTVQGMGRLCWRSQSGKKAGVQFVGLSSDLRSLIRNWLGIGNAPIKTGQELPQTTELDPRANQEQGRGGIPSPQQSQADFRNPIPYPTAAASDHVEADTHVIASAEERKPPSAFTLLAPPAPRPSAIPSEESPLSHTVPERSHRPAVPDTSLMFLPRKTALDGASPLASSQPMRSLSGAEQQGGSEDWSQGSDLLRSAIASRPPSPNNGSRSKGILIGTAVCAVLIALGVVIYSYPGMSLKLAWLTPFTRTQPASEPMETVGSRRLRRSVGRSRTFLRDWRSGQPIRDTAIFYDSQNEARFPVEVTDTSRERWLATVTNQNLTLNEMSDINPEGPSASSGGATSLAPSMSSPGSSLQFKGLMEGVLRNDGALVEEGARPSSPLNPSSRETVPKPIVVEAMIGRDGAVKNVRLISSPDSNLAAAVVAAVRQWRYKPLYENGRAIEFTTRVTFDFSGPSRKP